MKIAMVSMNAGPLARLGGVEGGGQSVIVDCLSRALSTFGHEITVYTQRDDPWFPECLITASGVHVDSIDVGPSQSSVAPTLPEAIETFRARLVEEWVVDRPDIVHAHSWISGKAAQAAARPLGIPVVQTFHGLGRAKRRRSEFVDPTPPRIDEEKLLLRSAARIIATSSAEVFALLEMGANPGAIKLIPSGVDLDLFTPKAKTVERAHGAFRLATLSRLVPDAGVGDVIDALRFVDDVELVVGGGGYGTDEILTDPDAVTLATLARARGVENRVSFCGRIKRDEVAPFLRAADAVVCAPWYDSIGTVALEAMACGVPVIVSAVGGHVDAVADGMTGTHVPPQSPRQIAYAISALKADPAQGERFGRHGVERTSARYGWSRIAAETFEVYQTAAARGSVLSRNRA